MKKKLIMLCIVSIYAIATMAQSRMERGQKAFDSGNYTEAITQWEAAAVVDKTVSSKAQSLVGIAKKCINLRASGTTFLQSGEYEKAESAYRELEKLNRRDAAIQEGFKMCRQGKAILAKESEAGKYWLSIKGSWDKTKYEQYISMYPKNKNAKDAKEMLQKIDSDVDLWGEVQKANTKASYKNYLDITKLGIYKQDAYAAIGKIEDQEAAVRNKILESDINTHIDQAELYMKAGRYQKARDELKKASELGELKPTVLQRYESVDEESLYFLCIENTKYHYIGKGDCEEYLSKYSTKDFGRTSKVEKCLKKHTKLASKDYDKVFNIGLSVFDLYYGNGGIFSGGPRLAFRIGSWDFPISFTASVAAYWNLGDKMGDTSSAEFSCWQAPLQGRVKINIFGNDDYKCYIAGGASYNINFAVKNSSKNNTDKLSEDIIHTTNSSAFGEIGICGEHYEVALFYSKDLQPFFNKEYIIEQYGGNSMLKQNQRFGVSWAYYF